ncbi:MAG TPA: hypothetical protein DCS93_00015 [Microscillaceae bacterium]|nr:hypothetical protein [Microscillaceae bacterium]
MPHAGAKHRYLPQSTRSFRQFSSTHYVNHEKESEQLLEQLYQQKMLVEDSAKQQKVTLIHKLHKFVQDNDFLVKSLNLAAPIQLPIGIKREIGNSQYIVLVDSISVDRNGNARLNTYMSITTPEGKKLAFEGSMQVSAEGGLVGEARLKLLVDVPLKFAKGVLLNVKANETYVSVDCNGFKELGLKGELTFTNLVEDSKDGTPGDKPIVTTFSTVVRSWTDLVVTLDMPGFQIKGIKGLGFRVENAVFDFSDSRNAANFSLPSNYDASWLPEPNSVLWKGIYFRSLKVALPRFIKAQQKQDSTTRDTTIIRNRVTFLGEELVLDETGFTGKVTVENLISRKDGDLDGWAFSIDHLGFAFQANTLNYFEIKGEINLPISPKAETAADSASYLTYRAMLDFPNDEFLFSAGTNRPIRIPMFGGKSKLELTQTYLEAKISQGKVHPRAILTGKFVIDNKILNIDELRFEGLELSSNGVDKFDRIDVRFGKKKAGKFPIQITELSLMNETQIAQGDSTRVFADNKAEDETAYLGIKLAVQFNFTKELPAEGYITLIAAKYKKNGYHKWRYKSTQINGIKIDVDQGAFLLKGSLRFFKNDEVYGNGFNGNITLGISTGGGAGFGMRASAIFGNVQGMRYWYADALVAFTPGLPLGPTGLAIYGFGGGLYSRMRKRQGHETGVGSDLGKTATGTVYIPDPDTKLGLKATVVLGTASSTKAFQGDVTFEIAFNQHGGIKYFGFEGYAYFLNEGEGIKVQDLVKPPVDRMGTVPLSAQVIIDYDVENRVFHMVAGVQVNIEKSKAKVTGRGQMVMHFAPDEWYIHIGTPDNKLTVDVELEQIKLNTGLYFMTGSSVPEIPPPPQEVLDILGMSTESVNSRSPDDLLKGKGFAIGFNLEIEKKFEAFVYLQAKLGLGFDISYKKYAESVRCQGREGTIGVNGWFGQGQAYMYVIGDLGVKFKKKKIAIGQISAALLAQIQFFNPLWAKGTLGGRFKVLGGLVKGKFKLSVEIGKHCDLVGANDPANLLADVQVISDITPTDVNGAVDVFTTPQVAFNMPIGVEFQLLDNNNQPAGFRAKLEQLEVSANNQSLAGSIEWNEDKDVAVYQTNEILPAESQIKVMVKLIFEEKNGGVWQPVMDGNAPYTEVKEVTFTSGQAPTYVPLFNIAASYPVMNQLHFHKGETNTGFIQLHVGQAYLFDLTNSTEWAAQKMRWKNTQTGETTDTDFTYDASKRQLKFDLAAANLKNTTIYQLDIVNLPPESAQNIDDNIQDNAKLYITNGDTLSVSNKEISGTQKNYQEQSVMDPEGMYFRTSKYQTLAEKFNALEIKKGILNPVSPYVDAMHNFLRGDELFDKVELEGIVVNRNGYKYTIPPLLHFKANINTTNWLQQKVQPRIYEGYPFGNGIEITWRPTEILGVPITGFVGLNQYEDRQMLNPDQLIYPSMTAPSLRILYDVAHYAYEDLYDLKSQIANAYSSGATATDRLTEILSATFPRMDYGAYPIQIQYVLPKAQNNITTTNNITLETLLGN